MYAEVAAAASVCAGGTHSIVKQQNPNKVIPNSADFPTSLHMQQSASQQS